MPNSLHWLYNCNWLFDKRTNCSLGKFGHMTCYTLTNGKNSIQLLLHLQKTALAVVQTKVCLNFCLHFFYYIYFCIFSFHVLICLCTVPSNHCCVVLAISPRDNKMFSYLLNYVEGCVGKSNIIFKWFSCSCLKGRIRSLLMSNAHSSLECVKG